MIIEMLHKQHMLDEGALVIVTLVLRGTGQPPMERFRELSEKIFVLGLQQEGVEQHKNIDTRFFRFTTA